MRTKRPCCYNFCLFPSPAFQFAFILQALLLVGNGGEEGEKAWPPIPAPLKRAVLFLNAPGRPSSLTDGLWDLLMRSGGPGEKGEQEAAVLFCVIWLRDSQPRWHHCP